MNKKMVALRMEKIPGQSLGLERKNIPPIQIHGESIASEKHPERNEDAMFSSRDKKAFGVFDGMGGEAGGQEASNLAKKYISNAFDTLPRGLSFQQEKDLMRDILVDANKKIWREKGSRPEGMNTTASVVRVWEGPNGERKAIVGNVGDSRVYIFRNGSLEQITLDDNLLKAEYPNENEARYVQEKMNNTVDPVKGLSAKEQDVWKKRNIITQYLGKENISPRIHAVDLFPGDQILICSDGISDNLTDMEMSVILSRNSAGNCAKEITDAASLRSKEGKANNARAKKDDMTAIVVEIPSLSVYQKEQERIVPREKQINNVGWERGMLTPVKRSNGKVEYWPIDFIETNGKQAIVSKPEPGGRKRIREVFLDKIPSVAPEDICKAKSEDELYYIIERLGGIQGSEQYYSSKDMILLLKDFFDDKNIPEDAITKTGGLRTKAVELKRIMGLREKIRGH